MKFLLGLIMVTICAGCAITEQKSHENTSNRQSIDYPPTPLSWRPSSVGYTARPRSYSQCLEPNNCGDVISNVIYKNWRRRGANKFKMAAVFSITTDDNYNVVELKLLQTGGNFAFDESCAIAIMSSSPFKELAALEKSDYLAFFKNFDVSLAVDTTK